VADRVAYGQQSRRVAQGLNSTSSGAALTFLRFVVAHCGLKAANAFAQALSQTSQLAGSEDQKPNGENDEQFWKANFSTKHDFLFLDTQD